MCVFQSNKNTKYIQSQNKGVVSFGGENPHACLPDMNLQHVHCILSGMTPLLQIWEMAKCETSIHLQHYHAVTLFCYSILQQVYLMGFFQAGGGWGVSVCVCVCGGGGGGRGCG